MAKRQRAWAKRAREALIRLLGGRCVQCGTTECLTLEHKNGCDWKRTRLDYSWRMSVYRWEAEQGRLTVLCISCNKSAGARRRYDGRRTFPRGYND